MQLHAVAHGDHHVALDVVEAVGDRLELGRDLARQGRICRRLLRLRAAGAVSSHVNITVASATRVWRIRRFIIGASSRVSTRRRRSPDTRSPGTRTKSFTLRVMSEASSSSAAVAISRSMAATGRVLRSIAARTPAVHRRKTRVRIGDHQSAEKSIQRLVFDQWPASELSASPELAQHVHGDRQCLAVVERFHHVERGARALARRLAQQVDQDGGVEMNHRFAARAG